MDSPSKQSSILVRVDYVANETSKNEDEIVPVTTEAQKKQNLNLEQVEKSQPKKRKLLSTPSQTLLTIEPPSSKKVARSSSSSALKESEIESPRSPSIPKIQWSKATNLSNQLKKMLHHHHCWLMEMELLMLQRIHSWICLVSMD